jgi:hypothetical protein
MSQTTLSDFVTSSLHDFSKVELKNIFSILNDQMVKTIDDLKEFSSKDWELLPTGARNRLRKGLSLQESAIEQVFGFEITIKYMIR